MTKNSGSKRDTSSKAVTPSSKKRGGGAGSAAKTGPDSSLEASSVSHPVGFRWQARPAALAAVWQGAPVRWLLPAGWRVSSGVIVEGPPGLTAGAGAFGLLLVAAIAANEEGLKGAGVWSDAETWERFAVLVGWRETSSGLLPVRATSPGQ